MGFGAILKGVGAGARSLEASREKEAAKQMLLEDRLALKQERARKQKADESAAQTAAITLEARLRGEGYVPGAEAGPDVTQPVEGKTLDALVNAASGSGLGVGVQGLRDMTPTRYGKDVGGYRYDRMSDAARMSRAEVAKKERDAAEPYKTGSTAAQRTYDAKRGVIVDEATGEVIKPGGLPVVPEDGVKPSDIASIRGQYNQEQTVKDASVIATAHKKIRSQSANPSPAGDMGVVFGYMKMLDPGSTVREGEYANAQNAAGVPERIRTAYNKAKDGILLGDAQRADFVAQADKIAAAHRQAIAGVVRRYSDIATRNRMNPKDVVYDPFEDDGDAEFSDDELAAAFNAGKRDDASIAAWIKAQRGKK